MMAFVGNDISGFDIVWSDASSGRNDIWRMESRTLTASLKL